MRGNLWRYVFLLTVVLGCAEVMTGFVAPELTKISILYAPGQIK